MNHHSFQSSRSQDEGERPFWISYADLMTALMILFLVVMVTSLSQITSKKVSEKMPEVVQIVEKPAPTPALLTPEAATREEEIGGICEELASQTAAVNPNILVDCSLNRITFGEVGQYKTNEYVLSEQGQQALFDLLPIVLETASSEIGEKWLKQVVIEGFTDTDGSYLYNLNLSLRRSEWLMCAILGHAGTQSIFLDTAQRKQIKQLFLAGGVSFNKIRNSKDASRRVELRLQFYGLGEQPLSNAFYDQKFEDGPNERCHI